MTSNAESQNKVYLDLHTSYLLGDEVVGDLPYKVDVTGLLTYEETIEFGERCKKASDLAVEKRRHEMLKILGPKFFSIT